MLTDDIAHHRVIVLIAEHRFDRDAQVMQAVNRAVDGDIELWQIVVEHRLAFRLFAGGLHLLKLYIHDGADCQR